MKTSLLRSSELTRRSFAARTASTLLGVGLLTLLGGALRLEIAERAMPIGLHGDERRLVDQWIVK